MVVYAMHVTQKMTMRDYDAFTCSQLPGKLPDATSRDRRKRVGDSIYDFSTSTPTLRPGVHGEGNRQTDLSGGWVLLSGHFYYFGDRPEALPEELLGLVKRGQGHRSAANAPFLDDFVHWIGSLGYPPGSVIGYPQEWRMAKSDAAYSRCAADQFEVGQPVGSSKNGFQACSSTSTPSTKSACS